MAVAVYLKKPIKVLNIIHLATIGLVDVDDVVSIMIALTNSDISNERFILVAESWTYKDFLKTMAKSVNASPPKKLAPQWLLQIAWRLDWLTHKLTGSVVN